MATRYFDVSDRMVSAPNISALFDQEQKSTIVVNKFGYDADHINIEYDHDHNKKVCIKGFIVYNKENEIVSQCKFIETENIDYWLFKYRGRPVNYSPNPYTPELIDIFSSIWKLLFGEDIINVDSFNVYPAAIMELDERYKTLVSIKYEAFSLRRNLRDLIYYVSLDNGCINLIYAPHGIKYQMSEDSLTVNRKSNQLDGSIVQKVVKTLGENNDLDSQLEVSLWDYCLNDANLHNHIHEWYNIVLDLVLNPDKALSPISTINYHLLKPCNMKCRHCFSKFEWIEDEWLELEDAKRIVSEISSAKVFEKVNFSGGEPLLYPHINELIEYTKSKGLVTSLVTNMVQLIRRGVDHYRLLFENLDMLAISMDSFCSDTNLKIGRTYEEQRTISYEQLRDTLKNILIINHDLKIKINSVITKINYRERLVSHIDRLKLEGVPIFRWKIMKVLPIDQDIKEFEITDDEFDDFITKNDSQSSVEIISEFNDDMEGSYLMVGPDGCFFSNTFGQDRRCSKPIYEVGIKDALVSVPQLKEPFIHRKGPSSK